MLCAGSTGDVQYEGDEERRRREPVYLDPADAVSVVPVRSPHGQLSDQLGFVWRGTSRIVEIVFANVADEDELPGGRNRTCRR